MKRFPYHSALKPEADVGGELSEYCDAAGVVFQHDLRSGCHALFRSATSIYSEPSWRAGYGEFGRRSGVESGGFDEYLSGLRAVVDLLGLPTYIVMGRHMIAALSPHHTLPVRLHGYDSVLGVWNADPPEGVRTNRDALAHAADLYSCLLDFSCGYGATALAMALRGKRFVCSDISRKCIYMVAKAVMGYEG